MAPLLSRRTGEGRVLTRGHRSVLSRMLGSLRTVTTPGGYRCEHERDEKSADRACDGECVESGPGGHADSSNYPDAHGRDDAPGPFPAHENNAAPRNRPPPSGPNRNHTPIRHRKDPSGAALNGTPIPSAPDINGILTSATHARWSAGDASPAAPAQQSWRRWLPAVKRVLNLRPAAYGNH